MFRKISQVEEYKTTLTLQDFNTNLDKVKKEIQNIERTFTEDQRLATNVNFNNNKTNLAEFLNKLKQKEFEIKQKTDIGQELDSNLFHDIGGKNVDISTDEGRNEIKRQLAALEKQIQVREETLAEIDNYIVTLLTGEMATLNISHTNAKFVKVAEDIEKQADEEIEDYYNELYQDSEGSPEYGTALEHPKETRNELTPEIHQHKFRKK